MKKRDKKLSLHRETVLRLDSVALQLAAGGRVEAGNGIDTSCGEPNCCNDGTGNFEQIAG
ncbi:MAG TPA: class I lanthipeptide [Thermoanaerobaculia bacterium]|nr:class I lanthipeptide [Thermoanaerobaculia bacterium]